MPNEWANVLDIGPDCVEHYVDASRVPEIRSLDISVAGVSALAGPYQIGSVSPCEHVLVFTIEGEGRLWLEGGEHILESDSVAVLPAGQPFLFEVNRAPWRTAWFDLEQTPRWRYLLKQSAHVRYCPNARSIFHLLSFLYHEPSGERRMPILQELDGYLSETTRTQAASSAKRSRIAQLFSDVEKQLHCGWTVEEMCQRVHYSAPHLHRLCRHHFNRSPIQQLIHLRMQRAQFLLANTSWSLAQVASSVGYSDVFNFSNRFKKSVGVSPSVFRKRSP